MFGTNAIRFPYSFYRRALALSGVYNCYSDWWISSLLIQILFFILLERVALLTQVWPVATEKLLENDRRWFLHSFPLRFRPQTNSLMKRQNYAQGTVEGLFSALLRWLKSGCNVNVESFLLNSFLLNKSLPSKFNHNRDSIDDISEVERSLT